MGAPATQGRLCTKLEEMEIGDYIRCTYIAPTANVAGAFSDIGGAVAETAELPTTPIAPPGGYFYYLKVDKGLLIADRMVQSAISAQSLNVVGYIKGCNNDNKLYRCLTNSEWQKYIVNGDLNGNINKRDAIVWNKRKFPTSKSSDGVPAYLEILQDGASVNVRTSLNVDGSIYTTGIHSHVYRPGDSSISVNIPIMIAFSFTSKILSAFQTSQSYQASFRPVLEYIDNVKSKTIWH